jgi:hypothetical protein
MRRFCLVHMSIGEVLSCFENVVMPSSCLLTECFSSYANVYSRGVCIEMDLCFVANYTTQWDLT